MDDMARIKLIRDTSGAGRIKLIRGAEDVEGHSADEGINVKAMKLDTDQGEITMEPQSDGRWKVTEGPDDVMGHSFKYSG